MQQEPVFTLQVCQFRGNLQLVNQWVAECIQPTNVKYAFQTDGDKYHILVISHYDWRAYPFICSAIERHGKAHPLLGDTRLAGMLWKRWEYVSTPEFNLSPI